MIQPAAPRHTRRAATAGFTLVELMIAVFLLGVGTLAVGRTFVIAQKHGAHGRQETLAVSLAQEIREKILSKDFDEVEAFFDGVDTDVPDTVTEPCQTWAGHLGEALGGLGRGRVTVMNPTEDAEITTGMLTVLIVVSWQEGGVIKDATMRFSVSRVGI